MKNRLSRKEAGFTLIELLIVIGVLSILIGLLAPAILKNMKTVERRKRVTECRVLEGDIMRFWHDQNKWPLPKGTKPDSNYKASYRDDNYKVFDEMMGVTFSGSTKDYLDPAEHVTTAQAVSDWDQLVTSSASLKDVLYGNSENKISKRQHPVLVYWYDAIKCPKCGEYSDMGDETCGNSDCDYKKEFGVAYTFKAGDRHGAVRALRPYAVTFDLLNNTVSVSQ